MTFVLSALELVVAERGRTAAEVTEATARTVRRLDDLGYHRVWFAEHHGTALSASVVPAVLIAHFAARTSRIRVGSGGVLAPNHAPLALAEQFATLATLYPDRIDMGIGRGPGTFDQSIVRALRRDAEPGTEQEYADDVESVLRYLSGEAGVRLIAGWQPDEGGARPWLLASSTASAELAGRLGLPIVLAHHIRPDRSAETAARYREVFTASRWADRPYVMVAVEAVVADSAEAAAWLARPTDLARSTPGSDALWSPAEAAGRELPEQGRGYAEAVGAMQARGTVDTVRRRFAEIVAETGADELMLYPNIYDPEQRIRSYELAVKAAGQ
ncbi:MsnO8 family LLM class oxidoreductase [Catenuloplanes japonicus]|uniref:MsnO8 family LLM class oxidoreductase n=1 Tax=Catenuloplanes japonicus TaxID=33876 RepID=UPI000526B16E|nr:MsnO8 family LLM class oxidoreductase [Catenuloplanes japonicus]